MIKCSNLNIEERRAATNDYVELVFLNKDIDAWNRIFVDIFGTAAKPAGRTPTKEDLDLTKDYGGIYDNQTLFKKEFNDSTIIVMFWPWQDGIHITLKMAVLKAKVFEEKNQKP